MRVLLTTPDYPPPPGGIQMFTKNLEKGLEKQGHEVEILESEPSIYSQEYFTAVPKLSLKKLTMAKQVLKYPYFNYCYQRTRKRIEAFDPDILHCLHRTNWPTLVAAQKEGVPSCLSTHALELEQRQETVQAARLAGNVHAVSQFTADLTADVTKEPTDSITIIPPSIDVSSYRASEPDQQEVSSDGPVVAIARLVPRKNVGTLVEAWSRVDESVKDGRDILIVGDGPNRDSLENEYGHHQDVSFIGWVSEEEKRALLGEASLFALVPRQFGFDVEGFGIVYIEAQAAGTPVVGSRTGGVPEAVGDGGVTVEDPTSPQEIAAAITTALDDGWQEEAKNAIAARVNQFNLDVVTDRHLEHYESLIEATGGDTR
jgi:phosphatidylinositol alpha-1,6-mannosyltransferase